MTNGLSHSCGGRRSPEISCPCGRAWVDEAVLVWLAEPEHRKGWRRTDEWVVRLEPETARSLVAFVSPRFDAATLWRDVRSIVKRLGA